jgi:hypothetical protein
MKSKMLVTVSLLVFVFLLGFSFSVQAYALRQQELNSPVSKYLRENYGVNSIDEYTAKLEQEAWLNYSRQMEALASEYPELNLPQNYMQAGTSTYQPPTLKSEQPFYAVVFDEPVVSLQVFSLSGLCLLGLAAVPPVKRRKQLRQALILGIVVLCVFSVGYFVGLTIAQTGTITIEPGSFTETASYVIWTDGTYVYAKNGMTGAIDFKGTDAAAVIQSVANKVISNGGGKITIRPGVYPCNSQIWIKSAGTRVPLIIEGESVPTGTSAYQSTRLDFSGLPLTNENTATCVRVGYRYNDDGSEVSNWRNNEVDIVIKNIGIKAGDTRYRGLVIEGVDNLAVVEHSLIYNCAYGVVWRGSAEGGVAGAIRSSTISGGYRDVNGISGAAVQLGDIINGNVIANGAVGLIIDNVQLLNIGYPPQTTTPTQGTLTSLRPAALRLIQGGRITVINGQMYLGGWGWGYLIHLWGSDASATQPITSSSPAPGGDIEVFGVCFEGTYPRDLAGNEQTTIDNIAIMEETDTGISNVYSSYFYGNSVMRVMFYGRRGRLTVEKSRVYYMAGAREFDTNTPRWCALGYGTIRDTTFFVGTGTIVTAGTRIYVDGEAGVSLYGTGSGSRSSPATLPTTGIPHYGNIIYYKLPAGASVSAGTNIYNAHHSYATDSARLPDFQITILQGTPELIFVGGKMDTTLTGFKLYFYAPSATTTTQDVIVKIQYRKG